MQAYVQDNNGDYPLPFQWQKAIAPYVKNQEVFRCPSLLSDYPADSNYDWDFARLDVFLPPFPTDRIRGVQEGAVALPASVVMVGETSLVDADGVAWYTSDVPQKSCGGFVGASTIHSGGADNVFVDGHVQWLTRERAAEIDCLNGPAPAPFGGGT